MSSEAESAVFERVVSQPAQNKPSGGLLAACTQQGGGSASQPSDNGGGSASQPADNRKQLVETSSKRGDEIMALLRDRGVQPSAMKRLRDDASSAASSKQRRKTMRISERDTTHHARSDDAHLAAKTDDVHLGAQTGIALVENVLSVLFHDVEDITDMAHQKTHEPRSQARSPRASFSQTLQTLKRSYISLLETTFESSWCSDRAASVRNLADAIKQELR